MNISPFRSGIRASLALCAGLACSPALQAGELPILKVDRVEDAQLAAIQGMYFGSNLLVGVRVDLISQWRAPNGAQMQGVARLLMQDDGHGGMTLRIHTDAQATGATDGSVPGAAANAWASGAEHMGGDGLVQVTQLAGDRNVAGNLTVIEAVPTLGSHEGYNGQAYAQAAQGGYTTEVHFVPGAGLSMQLSAPNGLASQRIGNDGSGGVAQAVRIAGDQQAASNTLQLQVQTSHVPDDLQRQLGVQSALSGLNGLPR